MPEKRCSEYKQGCVPLVRANQQTCSAACRKRRARRIKAAKVAHAKAIGAANALPEHLKELSKVARNDAQHIGRDLIKAELAPIVREAITDDVMQSIKDLVGLTPRAVELIALDMESARDDVRQKAYTLLMRYSVGNASVAPLPATQAPAPMQVVFQLPRPDDTPAIEDAAPVELLSCAACGVEKPITAMVDGSERCQQCHDALAARVAAQYG